MSCELNIWADQLIIQCAYSHRWSNSILNTWFNMRLFREWSWFCCLLLWSSLHAQVVGWWQAGILSQCSYHQLIKLIPHRQCGAVSLQSETRWKHASSCRNNASLSTNTHHIRYYWECTQKSSSWDNNYEAAFTKKNEYLMLWAQFIICFSLKWLNIQLRRPTLWFQWYLIRPARQMASLQPQSLTRLDPA